MNSELTREEIVLNFQERIISDIVEYVMNRHKNVSVHLCRFSLMLRKDELTAINKCECSHCIITNNYLNVHYLETKKVCRNYTFIFETLRTTFQLGSYLCMLIEPDNGLSESEKV